MSHIYCQECGFQNPESANYCARCGALLVKDEGGAETTQSFSADDGDDTPAEVLEDLGVKGPALVVRSGGGRAGETFHPEEETTIGRGEACDLGLFGDNTIERMHARILLQNNRYMLAHAGADGRTLLNGVEVGERPVPLRAGDEIVIGKSVLRFGERQKR